MAPQRAAQCGVCALPLGANTLPRPDPPVGGVWVSAWCWIRCGGCKSVVPVDRFDEDRAVCPGCGVTTWILDARRVFDHAHAVGDLAGPDPEGRFADARTSIADSNPFKSVGVLTTTSEDRHDELSTERGRHRCALSARVAPGHPLCEDCHRPLDVTTEGPGVLSARCASCDRSFGATLAAHHLSALGAVRGVLSIAHRDDRPMAAAEVGDDGAVTAVRCPDCTEVLTVAPERRTVRCEACKAVSVLPPSVWRVSSRDALSLYRAWVLFEGPSRAREELVRAVRRRNETASRASPRPPPPAAERPPPASPRPSDEGRRHAMADDVRRTFAASFEEIAAEQTRRARRRKILSVAFAGFFVAVTLAALFGR